MTHIFQGFKGVKSVENLSITHFSDGKHGIPFQSIESI